MSITGINHPVNLNNLRRGGWGATRFLKIILFYFLILLDSVAEASQQEDPLSAKKICLNMIVKDESRVIERCLNSVKNLIDYWVIVDTGSSDGTQEIIRRSMKDIPGQLIESPWVDFAHNRNEALSLAKGKGDYILFIDADEQLVLSDSFVKPQLEKDYYYATVQDELTECLRVLLVKQSLPWHWKGVVHEELVCPEAENFSTLNDLLIFAGFKDGQRARDPHKFKKDALILEKALENDPDNARYVLFLAQSYLCAKEYQMALKNFERRAAMGGREEEIFWCLYQVARMQQQLKNPPEVFIKSYCNAFHYRQSRAEPLFQLASYFYQVKNYILGYSVAQLALSIPIPQDLVHVEYPIYQYLLPFVLANCAFELKKYDEAKRLYEQILRNQKLPPGVRRETTMNLLITQSQSK